MPKFCEILIVLAIFVKLISASSENLSFQSLNQDMISRLPEYSILKWPLFAMKANDPKVKKPKKKYNIKSSK